MSMALPEAAKSPPSKRFQFIDVTRGIAILLAVMGHSSELINANETVGNKTWWAFRLSVHWATPAFLMMFGAMLEIVYFKRLQRDGMGAVMKRFLQRSASCWGCVAVLALSYFIAGTYSAKGAVAMSLFLKGGGITGNILQYYAIAIPFAMLILLFRARFGLWATLAVTGAFWIGHPIMVMMRPDFNLSVAAFPVSLITGYPIDPEIRSFSYFSLLHCSWITALGMLFGAHIRDYEKFAPKVIGIVALGTIALAAYYGGASQLVLSAIGRPRESNSPAFWVFSVMQACVVMYVIYWLVERLSPGARPWKLLATIGQFPLTAYLVGNALGTLVPDQYLPGTALARFGVAGGVTVVAVAVTLVASAWETRRKAAEAGSSSSISTSATAA